MPREVFQPGSMHVPKPWLAEAGAKLDDAVKFVVFLSDIRYFEAMNEVQAGFFLQGNPHDHSGPASGGPRCRSRSRLLHTGQSARPP